MKKFVGIILFSLVLLMPFCFSEEVASLDSGESDNWEGRVTISLTWQKLIGTFFGLNLKEASLEVSVRETIILFMCFLMFIILIMDVLHLISIFNVDFLGKRLTNFFIGLILSILVSLTGAMVYLKDNFLGMVDFLLVSLNLFTFSPKEGVVSILISTVIFWGVVFLIHELFSWLEPIAEGYSEVSRAAAAGRRINQGIN
jgi:hypothetical protein